MSAFFRARRHCVAMAAVLGGALTGMDAAEGRGPSNYSFNQVGIANGLPSNVARQLYQARDGYLWIGTEAGLTRYDGVRLILYRHADTPGLPDNLIRGFYEEPDGTLWVATQGGLARYRHGKFEAMPEFDRKSVSSLVGDGAGNIWIGTIRHGLWHYAHGRFEQLCDAKILPADASMMYLFRESTGAIWIGLVDGGLVRLDASGFTQPAWASSLAIAETTAMAETPRGTMWFGTARGLYRWRGGELLRWGEQHGFGAESVTAISPDRAGRLWIVARGAVWLGDTEKKEMTNLEVPGSNFCRSIIEDREGSHWIGTAGDGVIRMRPSAFRMVYPTAGNMGENVCSVAVDAQGSTWLGVAGRGLMQIRPDGSRSTYLLPANVDSSINSVLCARDGSVWVGTRGATCRWYNGEMQVLPEVSAIRTMFQDRTGVIWLGPNGRSVVRFVDGKFLPVAAFSDVAFRTPSCFAEDRDGAVYVGFSQGGVAKWKEGAVEIYNADNGLPDAEVRSLYPDADGNLWVGSKRRALAIAVKGRWFTVSSLTETFGDLVTAIAEDPLGNLWFGTPKGLVWAAKSDVMAVARGDLMDLNYHVTGQGEGMPAGLIGYGTQPAWARTADGEFLFVSRPGVIAVQPADLKTNPVAPPVVIEALTVDGRVVDQAAGLSLLPGTRSIAIDYTALSFVQSARIKFRYQLVGHDPDWVEAGARRTAYYTNLAPGDYQFRVMAANEDGVSDGVGATLAFGQQAWFYQTGWFYFAAAALGSMIVSGMFRWRTAGLRRQVQVQTELLRAQMAKEADLQAELERSSRLESLGLLAGGIAHDFNNLLTAIMGNLGLIALEPKAMALVGVEVEATNRAAKRASEVTQQLLTFAKGGDPVRVPLALADVVREAAGLASHGSELRIEFDFAPDLPPAHADAGQVGRVVHNLVLNAIQATKGEGVIRISLDQTTVLAGQLPSLAAGNYVRMTVADNGSGIPVERLSRLFDPYYHAKAGSAGLGLATARSIVKKHQGHIDVESQPGQGTTFRIWLPEARPAEIPAAESITANTATASVAKARVLVMDDEEVIRRLASDLLARMGHAATVVADGAAALQAFVDARTLGRPYDLVVLDLTVPSGMGGRETMEALQQLDPQVKAIVSSGYSSDPVMANFRAHGFRAVVPKPYNIEDLARTITLVLQG